MTVQECKLGLQATAEKCLFHVCECLIKVIY